MFIVVQLTHTHTTVVQFYLFWPHMKNIDCFFAPPTYGAPVLASNLKA